MNVLEYLSQKKSNVSVHSHPMAQTSNSFKYTYCFGLAVLVYGYKNQLPVTLECFSSILKSINLDKEQQAKLPLQVKKHFDLKINDVFSQITKKNEQYCFIADLYRIAFFGLISPTFCHDIIEGYTQVFNFTNSEKTFLKKFTDLGYQTSDELKKQTLSYYDTKLDSAVSLYKNFILAGYHISTVLLEYIYPSFSLTNELDGLILGDGSIKRFESNIRINGDIQISNCSTLVFDHANITLNGNIHINNGKIILRHSTLSIQNAKGDYCLNILNAPSNRIENTTIDSNSKCGFLNQESGQLKLQNSTIKNSNIGYAICFTGNSADINTSTFEYCKNGALFNHASKELFIASCNFINCINVHGGAIHSRSIADTTVYNCNFHNCHAQYIGGAVYFVNLKYGQSVIHCNFQNCTPADSVLFNVENQDDSLPTRRKP